MPPGRDGSTRSLPVALLGAAGLLLVARIALGVREHRNPPVAPDLVHWKTPEEADAAPDLDHPVLYEFSAAWCQPCAQLEQQIFADREHAQFIEDHFVPVRILDGDEKRSALAAALRHRFNVSDYPTMVIVGGRLREPQFFHGYSGEGPAMKFLRDAAVHGMVFQIGVSSTGGRK